MRRSVIDYVHRSQTVMSLILSPFLGVLRGAILRANGLLLGPLAVLHDLPQPKAPPATGPPALRTFNLPRRP